MPTYQYSCTECGHFFEQVQSFTEDSLTVCPECQGRLRKVFNAVGVVFKGSGFYRTDSRGGGSATDTATPSEKTDKSDKSAAKGGDKASSGTSGDQSATSASSGGSTTGAGAA